MSIEAKEVPLPANAENHFPGQPALPSSPQSALTAQGARLLERRSEARYPTRDPVEVQILGQAKLTRVAAMALDVSRKGLRIELLAPIPKGSQVEIILAQTLIIFGEVRYCRRVGEAVHAGILIQQVVYPRPSAVEHMSDEVLSLYLVGKGLMVSEVIQLKEHLILCNACQLRLTEMNAILNPVRKRKGLGDAG